ncbi:MAG: PIN domain-containing protein [Solirubrobacteraceae bacterium]
MSRAEPPRAILDADIIYSRVLHDLMGRVAGRLGLLDLVWSEELLTETKRVLMQRKGLTDDAAQRWVSYLHMNFPDGETDISQTPRTAELDALTTDPDDRHVCALAIASDADYLFTHDRGYLADRLATHGVEVTHPDPFLAVAFESQPQAMLDLLKLQASLWAGGRPIAELLDALERAGAVTVAEMARNSLF